MLTRASARALIGGRWAVSVQGWLIVVVAVAIFALAARSGPATNTAATDKLQLMLLGMTTTGAVLGLAHLTLFRNRATHPVPIWWVMAVGAIAWLTTLPFRFQAGFATFGASPGTGAGVRDTVALVLLLAVQGSVGLCAIALGLASRDAYRRRRAQLMDTAVRQEAARLRDIGAIGALRTAAMEDIGRDIGPSVKQAARAAGGAADLPALADLLSETATGVLRPRSHDLWRSASASLPRVRPRSVLSSALRRYPLPLTAAIGTFAILILTGVLVRTGWSFLPAAIACLASTTIIYAIGRRIIAAHPARTTLVGVCTIVSATTAVVAMPLLAWDPHAARTAAVIGAAFLVSALAASVAITALRTGEEVISELADIVDQRAVEQAALRREVMALDRELASHLHGTVQARLMAASYALREADRTGDRAAGRQAAEAAQQARAAAMAAPVPPLPSGAPTDLRTHVSEQWDDVLTITWSRAPGPLTPDEAHSAAEVLRHALKNAVVHGGATAADIAMGCEAGSVTLTIADDGAGPAGGAPGLGSRYLDEVAEWWSLEPGEDGGALLRVRLTST